MNRRNFLASTAALAATSVAPAALAEEKPAQPPTRKNRIAVSTYSFWRFLPDTKVTIEDCIRHAAAMGFDGVEILHRQMEGAAPRDNTELDNAYLQNLKRVAILEGVDLCGFSIHQ